MVDTSLSEESQRMLGRDAQRNNILAARVIAETVKTTLGPKGMDKMLVDRSGGVTVTNDGVTILNEMEIEHPAAKMIVEVAKTQEKEVGDGTTTAVMIAGKLLENAEKLLDQKIHPTIITRGYRWAEEKAQEYLEEVSVEIDTEEELSKVASTAMTGKGAEYLKEKFADIIVKAVKIVAKDGPVNLEDVRLEKQKGGSIEDTSLIQGIVLQEERIHPHMPLKITNAKIALLEEALEIKNPANDTRISISMPDQLQSFMNQEEAMLKNKVEYIKTSGANVIICKKGIDPLIGHYLAKENIFALKNISEEDLKRISKATGGKIISKLSEISIEDLGSATTIEEKREDETSQTYITGCTNPGALTILIRGGTTHVLDEIERAMHDAMGDVKATIKDSKVIAGGGAVEIEVAKRIRKFAKTLKGRERLAVEEFGNALECIPSTLAENAGLDPIDTLTELRANHDANNKNAGLNLFSGKIEDTLSLGIIEPLKVKTQAISSATEVAIMILRIDDVIAARKPQGAKANMSRMGMYE